MTPPLVSIALCTYNGAAYLNEQLDSLVKQDYPNLELVIVDDGSTDDTSAIVTGYANKYPWIKCYVNPRNLGYIKNFEKAIGLCSGDYIALCDQDDIWDFRKISIMVNAIGDNIMVYHDSLFVDEAGQSLQKKVSDIRNCYSGSDSRIFLFENCVSGHAMLFKRELLNYVNGFNVNLIHDWWLAYAAVNNGSVLFLNQALVKYRQHGSANTNILRQKRSDTISTSSLEKIERQLQITTLFSGYEFNRDAEFKFKLAGLMEKRMESYTSFSLAFFVFKHRRVLLYIQKKSGFSKLNFIMKMIWGYKFKSLFE